MTKKGATGPRVLKPFAAEAWRRNDAGELEDEEIYPCDAQWAGIFDRFDSFTQDEYERRLQIAPSTASRRMADVFTAEERSAVMARIRSRGNRDTELRLIALFRAHGITGWRRNRPLFGKPDFVFRKERVAVFVDGCFWHGCPKPKHAPLPKNRAEWWAAKLRRNRERDLRVTRALRKSGWRVVRVWECDLVPKRQRRVASRIRRWRDHSRHPKAWIESKTGVAYHQQHG